MTIESEIFKKSTIIYDKLLPYGFKKIDKGYTISKNILNDTFRIDIEISDSGIVTGKIYDLSFQDEYINYRIENQTGEFVNKIRDEFIKMLVEIRENCTIISYFIMDQTNRITNLISERYKNKPEFIWEKFPGYGIFRNPHNGKWYGLIMNINKNKIDQQDKENKEVEVLNVKLEEDEISNLLNRKGFYKAYHMNKKNWITILLDDTIKDEEIMNYIDKSYEFTE